MKKLFYFLIVSFIAAGISSCNDDEPVNNAAPAVTSPAISSLETGGSVTLDFTYTSEAGFASAAVTVSGGTADITTNGTAGETTGTITVTFNAGTTPGAGAVVLAVTDADGNTGEATAVLTITDGSIVTVTTNITGEVSWTADKTYILDTRVTVVDGATLNIEGGTVIKGAGGQGANSTALLVARGGTLNANGTATAPIIFTSVLDEITPSQVAGGDFTSPNLSPTQSGLWGGVIILGNAPINVTNEEDLAGIPNTESQIEGIPVTDTNGRYGGNDAADNSGTIRYISIRHGGTNIGAGNEINGLTLGGVGSGTTIEWVEVVANNDDGIEWFGGTVDVTGALIWNSGDDSMDTDQDWTGTCDNFIIVTPIGGSAFELDGPEGVEGTASGNANSFTNGTVYAGEDIDHLVDWDPDTNTGLSNIYFYGWDDEYATDGFAAIESFGGDESGTTGNWEYTLTAGGATFAQVFPGVPESALTEVNQNANTVGAGAASGFAWTWASQADGLSGIGIE
ncbi:MAG: hypothetical protein AAFQ94_12025 [Bacteroidota bacterium]